MRLAVFLFCLLGCFTQAHAAVSIAVNQQSGAAVQERASQLARKLGSDLGTPVHVVSLPDAEQVDAWLNRYATADLALVSAEHVAARPGRYVMITPVGRDLVLIGRQGIGGDLPQRAASAAGVTEGRPAPVKEVRSEAAAPVAVQASRKQPGATPPPKSLVMPKSIDEDRYYVRYVYQERLGRDPDAEDLEFWVNQLRSGTVTKQQLFEISCNLEKKSCNNR